MFNVGFGELVFILGLALLVLGPRKLPELARGIGRFMREFRRQSEEIRQTVEREFYQLDRELQEPLPKLGPPEGTLSSAPLHQAPVLPSEPEPVDPNEALHAAYPEPPPPELVAATATAGALPPGMGATEPTPAAAPEAGTAASSAHEGALTPAVDPTGGVAGAQVTHDEAPAASDDVAAHRTSATS